VTDQAPEQLSLDDALDEQLGGFNGWDVFKRRGRTVGELAVRWGVSDATALGFLLHFARLNIAVESRGLWYATEAARRRFRFLVGFGDGDER
jgi:hypothetical protein